MDTQTYGAEYVQGVGGSGEIMNRDLDMRKLMEHVEHSKKFCFRKA